MVEYWERKLFNKKIKGHPNNYKVNKRANSEGSKLAETGLYRLHIQAHNNWGVSQPK